MRSRLTPSFGRLRFAAGLLRQLPLLVVTYLPGEPGVALRRRYYGSRLKHMGEGVRLDVGVQIEAPELVSIGDRTWIDRFVIILAGPANPGERKVGRKENPGFQGADGEVIIGRKCHIAPFAVLVGHGGLSIGDNCGVGSGGKLYSVSHHHRNPVDPEDGYLYRYTPFAPESEQALFIGPVVMEESSGLALNSTMLPGSTIGENSWVGMNSVVFGRIPPDTIAAGNPAEPVKSRRDQGPAAEP